MRALKLSPAVIALACALVAAQQTSPSGPAASDGGSLQQIPQPAAQPSPQASASAAVPVQSTADAPEVTNASLRPVQGELEKKLDSKTAKAGDVVVVKTTDKAAIAVGTVIQKGSKIVGQVVDAHPAGDSGPNAKVTVQFDHAELKGGQRLPLKTVLQSVAPAEPDANPAANGIESSTTVTAPVGSRSANPAPGASTTSPMGGSAAALNAGPTPSASQTAPRAANAQGGNAAPVAGTVVAQQGNIAVKTTAIPGVLIAASSNGQPFSNAAGTFVGARQDVHLDSGTRVVLAVTGAQAKGSNAK